MIRERVRMSIKVRVTVRIREGVRRVRGIWLCLLIVSYELAISEQEVMSQRVSRAHSRVTNQAVRGGGGGGESGCQGGGGGGGEAPSMSSSRLYGHKLVCGLSVEQQHRMKST